MSIFAKQWLVWLCSLTIAFQLTSNVEAGRRHRDRKACVPTQCCERTTEIESPTEAISPFAPIRVVVICSTPTKLIKRDVTAHADVDRIWQFVHSHLSQLHHLVYPTPPVAGFEFYNSRGEMQMVNYNAGGFHGLGTSLGDGPSGFLTRNQSKTLDQILKDYTACALRGF